MSRRYPHTPWWEVILIVLAIGSVIVYASSLATSWWPSRKRSEKNRRFSRIWGWTMPAMVVLVLGLAFVDTRWQDHRKDLGYERDALVRELSTPVIEQLSTANDVAIEMDSLSVVSDASDDLDLVQATLPDGTEVFCRINVVVKDGQRFAEFDRKSCR